MKCIIDFTSGQHGHFLEYVVSKYIYNMDLTDDLFDELGTCDGFTHDEDYTKRRLVKCRHLTSCGSVTLKVSAPIVFIKHCATPKYEYIWLVNFFFKAGFVINGYVSQLEQRTDELVERHKENWYDKLETKSFHIEQGLYNEYVAPNEKFDFRFEAFFSLQEFLIELQSVAEFLNMRLTVNDSLIALWHEFIEKNQGYTHYTTASTLLDGIVNGASMEIEDNWRVHAFMNRQLSSMFDIWDGPLFEDVPYPTNTKEIHDLITGI